MAARFCVLASGSSGNAGFLEFDGFGLLLDAGLGPRQIAARLRHTGQSWREIRGVLLTHTHGDHWNELTLTQLLRQRIPLYCHPEHVSALGRQSAAGLALAAAGLIRHYEPGEWMDFLPGIRGLPLPLSHDGGPTFGFRLEGPAGLFGPSWAIGYAADLGTWDEPLARALADVDLLAVEFNHDEEMQLTSGRPQYLIDRVLGDRGHLSNSQGAALVRAVVRHSSNGRLRHLLPLHLSRQCNRPELAAALAKVVLDELDHEVEFHLTSHDTPTPVLCVGVESTAASVSRVRARA